MTISHKVITLGLEFGLLGSTCAFARPTPHFENGCRSYARETVESHVSTAEKFGATGYARLPSAHAVKDDWPANMLLD